MGSKKGVLVKDRGDRSENGGSDAVLQTLEAWGCCLVPEHTVRGEKEWGQKWWLPLPWSFPPGGKLQPDFIVFQVSQTPVSLSHLLEKFQPTSFQTFPFSLNVMSPQIYKLKGGRGKWEGRKDRWKKASPITLDTANLIWFCMLNSWPYIWFMAQLVSSEETIN